MEWSGPEYRQLRVVDNSDSECNLRQKISQHRLVSKTDGIRVRTHSSAQQSITSFEQYGARYQHINSTSRHAALRRDCLYPPARPSVLVSHALASHAAGVTSRFWIACHSPSPLFRPAAGLRSSPAARSVHVSHARSHTSSQSDYYI